MDRQGSQTIRSRRRSRFLTFVSPSSRPPLLARKTRHQAPVGPQGISEWFEDLKVDVALRFAHDVLPHAQTQYLEWTAHPSDRS